MSNDEARIEAQIQAKGLNAPRLTPDHIDACISAEAYHVFSDAPELVITVERWVPAVADAAALQVAA